MKQHLRFKKALLGAAMSVMVLSSSHAMAESLSAEKLMNIEAEDLSSPELKKYATTTSMDVDHRMQAVREASKMVGAQHGYNARMKELQDSLRDMSDILDMLYDFRTLMTLASGNQNGKYLIPAILSESSGVTALSPDAKMITISERQYQIVRPARLTLRAPHWKSYLLGGDTMELNLPSELLFPKNKDERESWKDGIKEGLSAGRQMADREMITRMTRMHQDFKGISKNLRLTKENKLQQTLISYEFEMSNGGGDSLSENQHVYRIAAPASLNGNVSDWQPIIMDSRDSLYFPLEGGVYVDPMGEVK